MATDKQKSYIADLTVAKTKEFKEVKELITSAGIVNGDTALIQDATTIADITNSITDYEASQIIDLLINTKEPVRGNAYSAKRVDQTTGELEHIQALIHGWGFPQ